METLALELQEEILSYLFYFDLINISRVTTHYYNICSNYSFWTRMFKEKDMTFFFLERLRQKYPFPTPFQFATVYSFSHQENNCLSFTCRLIPTYLFENIGFSASALKTIDDWYKLEIININICEQIGKIRDTILSPFLKEIGSENNIIVKHSILSAVEDSMTSIEDCIENYAIQRVDTISYDLDMEKCIFSIVLETDEETVYKVKVSEEGMKELFKRLNVYYHRNRKNI